MLRDNSVTLNVSGRGLIIKRLYPEAALAEARRKIFSVEPPMTRLRQIAETKLFSLRALIHGNGNNQLAFPRTQYPIQLSNGRAVVFDMFQHMVTPQQINRTGGDWQMRQVTEQVAPPLHFNVDTINLQLTSVLP